MTRHRVLLVLACGLAGLSAGTLDPRPSHAEEPAQKVARLGFVHPNSPSSPFDLRNEPGFWNRLSELGWVRGQNLFVEERWAEGRYDRLPALMSEVVGRKVDVLVTAITPAAVAAKNATSTIPIVDALMGDPIDTGIAASLARPGGNLTGLSLATQDLSGKRLQLLQETVPRLSTVAVISNPESSPWLRKLVRDMEPAARTRGLKVRFIDVRQPGAFTGAFRKAGRRAQAALVVADPLTVTRNLPPAIACPLCMGFSSSWIPGG